MSKKPLKIEFEGTDGAGKTTGMEYFVEKLRKAGLSVVATREVGNPHIEVCERLRKIVLDPTSKLSGESMELIFSAMRFENQVWFNKLQGVDIVVSDRGWLSHLAYTDNNVSKQFTTDFYENFMQNYTQTPDIVIYFKVSTDVALQRRVKRGLEIDSIEIKGTKFQEKVRQSFEHYIDKYDVYSNPSGKITSDLNSTFLVYNVDANKDLDNVKKQLNDILLHIL